MATTLLPNFLEIYEFVNADAIASALSPFRPDTVARQAGRLMLKRLDALAEAGEDFAFESTLASRSFPAFLEECRARQYSINLLYVWLNSPELAALRVAHRVRAGGHHIPTEVIHRRYERGRRNFLHLYRPFADTWTVTDNSNPQPQIVAQGGREIEEKIFIPQIWQTIIRENQP